MFRDNFDICIATLEKSMDKDALRRELTSALESDIRKLIQYEDVYSNSDSWIGIKYIDSSRLAQRVSDIVSPYITDDIGYDEITRRYFETKTDERGILVDATTYGFIEYFLSNCSDTFFGRFYRHLGL